MNFGREFFFNHPCLSGQKLHCKPETRGLQVEWVMMSIHILPLNPPNQICTKFVPIFDQISPVLAGLGGESASEMDFFLTIPPPPFQYTFYPTSNTLSTKFYPTSNTLSTPYSDTLSIPISDTLFYPHPLSSIYEHTAFCSKSFFCKYRDSKNLVSKFIKLFDE